MARKVQVYLALETLAVLDADVASGASVSGRINAVVLRYAEVCRRSCPALSRGEWCAICDANNGCFLQEHQPGDAALLWANVADSEGLDEKWGIDAAGLVAKMRGWSAAESAAAIEVAAKFWRHCELETDEALRFAEARIEA